MTTDLAGKEVRGYRILDIVGTGAFGAVYRAQQKIIDREVAIKIILPEFANRPDFIRSFEAEAQLVARLEHIHIVPLFDYWRDPEGAYLVMRLLPDSLRDELASHENGMPLDKIATILDQIAAALRVAHRNGVVHRDLKPGNILLDADGNAFLADFGIAKILSDDSSEEEETISGTPAYISPEQINAGAISPQTDIYALGVLLFEMVTGQLPFDSKNISDLIFSHLNSELPSVLEYRDDLPEMVDEVIARATEKDPSDRYDDTLMMAREFRESLATADGVFDYDEHALETLQLVDVVNPYKGLRAFEEADAADFFGRGALIDRLLGRLAERDHALSRFLAVVGPSGSGKSSVVKAGVVPALRQGRLPSSDTWYIAEMVPNTRPISELEQELISISGSGDDVNIRSILESGEMGLVQAVDQILPETSQLVLVIDQFEEAFTMVPDEDERAAFLEMVRVAVSHPDSRLRVIVTLRADFMDQPLAYPGFGELMRQRTEFVLPMSPEEIQLAITGPAERVGLQVDPDLVAAVISDLNEEPGSLPLLQYALTEVFERREGLRLTLSAYVDSGGATGALARRAEQLYMTMGEDSQLAVKQLFLRLVTLGEGKQDTRRRVGWSELSLLIAENAAMLPVRDAFVKYRLLTTDRDPQTREPTLEIAHEALIRRWQRLLDWLNESREDIRIQRRLGEQALQWREADREKSFLMTGSQVEQMAEWFARTDLALTEEERAFIVASVVEKRKQDERERLRQVLRIERERQLRNRLQLLLAVMVVAVGVALGLMVFGFTQASQQETRALTAIAGEDQALSTLAARESEIERLQLTAGIDMISPEAVPDAADGDVSTRIAMAARDASEAGDDDLAQVLALAAVAMDEPSQVALDTLADLTDAPDDIEHTQEALLAYARDLEIRALTCEERLRYTIEPLCEPG